LEALVREVRGVIYGKDIFIQPSLGLAECTQRFIGIDEFIGIDQFNEPQITVDITDQGTCDLAQPPRAPGFTIFYVLQSYYPRSP
jgi:hypothetical protein